MKDIQRARLLVNKIIRSRLLLTLSPKMNKDEQITLLRTEHANAINSFDFDRAEVIMNQIRRLQNEIKREQAQVSDRTFDIDEQREIIMGESAKQSATLMQQRVELQKKYHQRYKRMQKQHTDEQTELANQHTMALEREASRPIPEVEKLLNESKVKGRAHAYAEAKAIYQEAMRIKERVINERKNVCNAEYDRQKQKMLSRQKKEMELLTEKQETAIKELDQRHEAQENLLKNRMKIKERKAAQPVTPRKVMMQASPAVRKRRSASVTRSQRTGSSLSSIRSSSRISRDDSHPGSRVSYH